MKEKQVKAPGIYINLQNARDAVEDLDKEQIADIFLGILDYFEGKEPNISDDDKLLKKAIKPLLRDIDHNNENYIKKCNSQREKALKRWGRKQEDDMPMDSTAYHGINGNADDAKYKDKDNSNNKDNNKDKDKSLSDDASESESINLDEIKEKFNSLIDENKSSMRKIRDLQSGSTRAKSVVARIKRFGIDQFFKALENATKSEFFNDSAWASFDWIIKPNNFPKVLEGNYNKEQQNGNSNGYQKTTASELQGRIDFGGTKSASAYEF